MLFPVQRILVIGFAVALIAPAPPGSASPTSTIVRGGSSRAVRQPGGTQGNRRAHPALCSGSGTGSFIGANNSNVADGDYSGIVSGQNNFACGEWAGVMVGFDNEADGAYNFIGGGSMNTAEGSFNNALVGGHSNDNAGINSFIGSGQSNRLTSRCMASSNGCSTTGGASTAIVAGIGNTVNGSRLKNANGSIIGAGQQNSIIGQWAAIVAGTANEVTGDDGFIGGGSVNSVTGKEATIPGGMANTAAGNGSFAAGRGAEAFNDGAFVWSDTTNGPPVQSTASNQFVARASGGVMFFSNNAETAGVTLAPGSGSWSSVSDRSVKRGIAAVDPSAILAKVATLPVTEWTYESQTPNIRHIGPMAQDFYAAFGVGEDDRHITTVDEGGVALAAIKGLHAENEALQARVAKDGAEIAALRSELARIAATVDAQRGDKREGDPQASIRL